MIRHISIALFVFYIIFGLKVISLAAVIPPTTRRSSVPTARLKINQYLQSSLSYLDRPGELVADLDSAMVLARQAERLSNGQHFAVGIGKAIVMEGKIYREMGKRELGQTYLFRAIDLFKKYNCYKELGDTYVTIGEYYQNEGKDLLEKIVYYKLALPYYHKADAKEAEGEVYKHLGDFYYSSDENFKALDYLQKAVIIFKSIGFKKMHFVYDLLAIVYIETGQYDLAMRYEFLALNIADELNDTGPQLTAMYYHTSLIYKAMNQDTKALNYARKGLEIADRNKVMMDIHIMRNNLINLLTNMSKFDEALSVVKKNERDFPPVLMIEKVALSYQYLIYYTKSGRFAAARHYSIKLLSFLNEAGGDNSAKTIIALGSIIYLQKTGQFELSNRYIDLYLSCTAVRDNPLRVADIERLYFRSDSATGNLSGAIRHLQRAGFISDSVLKVNSSKQMSKMMVQFETEKKDKDLKISVKDNQLLSRRAQMQDIALKSEKVLRNVTLGGIVMMLLLLGLGYNRFLLKQRTQRKMEAQQEFIFNQNSSLQTLLGEKEWLLKEIHHRVKNNLQIVISLLNTQSLYLDNADAIDIINKSQNRMQVISLIHQKLYQTDNLATIDVNSHIKELVNYLTNYFEAQDNVVFELDILPLKLDISRAVPLGLILNEAISNSLKYAFEEGRKGTVKITLISRALNDYVLCIKDNGKGLPDNFEINEKTSLGMSLMQGLSDQIGGEFMLKNEQGLEITVIFNNPDNPLIASYPKTA